MDKVIQLGIETRRNDSEICKIESSLYVGDISEGKALDLIVQQLERFNKTWKRIIDSGKISKNQFMLEQEFHALNIN